MRTIEQALYNVDQLNVEVVNEIVSQIGEDNLTDEERGQLRGDRRILMNLHVGNTTLGSEVEFDWRRIGERYGVVTYDAGEQGMTIVGTEAEVAEWIGVTMTEPEILIYKSGQHYVAHRPDEPRHDCASDESPHGVADTAVGALRRLLRAEEVAKH